MKLILSAIEPTLADAWHRLCGDIDIVSLRRGSIIDLKYDAVASPVNSFGFMDGGIDRIYGNQLGWKVQDRLQRQIREWHRGELLVGNAEIVSTDRPRIPYLIAAQRCEYP